MCKYEPPCEKSTRVCTPFGDKDIDRIEDSSVVGQLDQPGLDKQRKPGAFSALTAVMTSVHLNVHVLITGKGTAELVSRYSRPL